MGTSIVDRLFRSIPVIVFAIIFAGQVHPQHARQTISDDLGRTVTIPHPLARIVSLAPNVTEIIYALGVDSILAGVTDYCDYPPQATLKPHMGGIINPNIETIVGTRPDLVLMSVEGNSRLDCEKLEKLSIPVVATNPRTIDGVMKSILDIGKITGASQTADRLVAELRSRRDSILATTTQLRRPRVLVIFSLTPLMVAGSSSFINDLITDAGGSNIGAMGKGSYPIFSREEILSLQPEKIILTSDIAVSSEKLLQQFPEWRTLDVLRDGAISSIDASIISRPGPRVVQAIAELARIIHR